MKRTLRLSAYITTVLALASMPLSTSTAASSDPQLLIAATTSQTRQVGETVSIAVNIENSATAALKTQLQYDGDMLRYQGISQADSNFSAVTIDAADVGTLSVEATGGTGDATTPRRVAAIIFAVERAGSSEVAFGGVNQIQVQNCLLFICNKVYKSVAVGPAVSLTLQAAAKSTQPEKSDNTKQPTITPEPSVKQPSTSSNLSTESKKDNKKVVEKKSEKKKSDDLFTITGLSVSEIASSTATVIIETSAPSSGVLIYQSRNGDAQKIELDKGATLHRIELDNLTASTEFAVDVAMKNEHGVLIHSDVIFRTLDIVTSGNSTTTSAKTEDSLSTTSFVDIAGVSLGAIGSLALVGWALVYLAGVIHKIRLTEAGVLATRRYTLRRFTRL